jgi:hypothetical protein
LAPGKASHLWRLRTEEIDWLRWMAANIQDKDVLEKLSQDTDIDVRMWVVCNPVTPRLVLEKLAEDPIVFVRRGVAQNSSIPAHLLIRLNADPDISSPNVSLQERSSIETKLLR